MMMYGNSLFSYEIIPFLSNALEDGLETGAGGDRIRKRKRVRKRKSEREREREKRGRE